MNQQLLLVLPLCVSTVFAHGTFLNIVAYFIKNETIFWIVVLVTEIIIVIEITTV